jgi:hypothetical protein
MSDRSRSPHDKETVVDPRVELFGRHFDKAFGSHYEPTNTDYAKLKHVLEVGTLKGENTNVILEPAIKVLRAFGHPVSWTSVLSSLSDHREKPHGVGAGFEPPKGRQPTHRFDEGRPDMKRASFTDQLLGEGWSEEEVKKAMEVRQAALETSKSVIKRAMTKQASGWTLVEEQRAHQSEDGLSTERAHDQHLVKEGLWNSWEYYQRWKGLHPGEEVPGDVNRIRSDPLFREWVSSRKPLAVVKDPEGSQGENG